MILIHGANSISGKEKKELPIYLTNFNNFDNNTKIDIPMIGDSITYDSYFTKGNSLGYLNSQFDTIRVKSPNWRGSSRTLCQTDSNGTYSAEFICRNYRGGFDGEADPGLFGIGFCQSGNSNALRVHIKNLSNIQIYVGYLSGDHVVLTDELPYGAHLFHIAVIRIRTEVYIYLNGNLVVSGLSDMPSVVEFGSYTYYYYSEFSQVAIWDKDMSSNNKMTYPIRIINI